MMLMKWNVYALSSHANCYFSVNFSKNICPLKTGSFNNGATEFIKKSNEAYKLSRTKDHSSNPHMTKQNLYNQYSVEVSHTVYWICIWVYLSAYSVRKKVSLKGKKYEKNAWFKIHISWEHGFIFVSHVHNTNLQVKNFIAPASWILVLQVT